VFYLPYQLFVVLVLTLSPSHAVPNGPTFDKLVGCGPKLDRVSALPDPRSVAADDYKGMLTFIAAVTTLPPAKTVEYALNIGLENLWRLYRPDLTSEDIRRRLEPIGFNMWTLRKLGVAKPSEREIARLTSAWRKLVFDLDHDRFEVALNAHRDRVLAVPLERRAILDFLAQELPEIPLTSERTLRWFEALYRQYVPRGRPDPILDGGEHRDVNLEAQRRILQAWQTYVFDLTGERIDLPHVGRAAVTPFRTKMVDVIPTRIEDVADDARSIIAFLANRYQHLRVSLNTPDALDQFVRAFRAEFGLAPRDFDIPSSVILIAAYGKRDAGAQYRVRLVWHACLEDLTGESRALPAQPGPSYRSFRLVGVTEIPLNVSDVRPNPHSIIAFLANRYRDILFTSPFALANYLNAFRDEHGLPTVAYKLPRHGVQSAYYRSLPKPGARTVEAWLQILREMNAQTVDVRRSH